METNNVLRLSEALRALPLCLFVVCDRTQHSNTLDGIHDTYTKNTQPCPARMAPFHLESYVPATQMHHLNRSTNDLSVLKESLEWSALDMIVFYSNSTYTTLAAAHHRCSVPKQHVVFMPHEAVRRACTNALTGRIDFLDMTLEHVMAWATRFCADAAPLVLHQSSGKRIQLNEDFVRAHRQRLATEHELAANIQQLKIDAVVIALHTSSSS